MSGSSSSADFNPWDWHIKLRDVLSADFDDDALRRVSAALGLDWESLPGEDRRTKARGLVEAAVRANRVGDLVAAGKRERPNEPWDAIAAGAKRFPLTLPPAPSPPRQATTTPPPASPPRADAPSSLPPLEPPALPPTAESTRREGSSRALGVLLGIIGVVIVIAAVACVGVNYLWNAVTARVSDGLSTEVVVVATPNRGGSNAPPAILTGMAAAGATAIAKYGTPSPAPPGTAAYPAPTKRAAGPLAGYTAVLTDTQDRQYRVAASSLRWQSMNEILLDGDRSIPLNTVRAIEVTGSEPTTELQITLADGSTVTGRPAAGCGFSGATAIGPLQLACSKLKGVEMTTAGAQVAPIPTRALKNAAAVITDAQGRQTTVRADTLRWSGIDEIWLDGGQTVRFDRISAIDASVSGSTPHLAITLANGDQVDGDAGGSCRFGAQDEFGAFEIGCDRLKRIEIRDASAGPPPSPVAGRSLKGLTAVITDSQGKETRGPADSLRWRGIAEIWLDSGQTVTFDKVRAIDVSGDQSAVRMKITLVNGAALDDAISGGCWFNVQAASDVSLRCDQIRRIEIQ